RRASDLTLLPKETFFWTVAALLLYPIQRSLPEEGSCPSSSDGADAISEQSPVWEEDFFRTDHINKGTRLPGFLHSLLSDYFLRNPKDLWHLLVFGQSPQHMLKQLALYRIIPFRLQIRQKLFHRAAPLFSRHFSHPQLQEIPGSLQTFFLFIGRHIDLEFFSFVRHNVIGKSLINRLDLKSTRLNSSPASIS